MEQEKNNSEKTTDEINPGDLAQLSIPIKRADAMQLINGAMPGWVSNELKGSIGIDGYDGVVYQENGCKELWKWRIRRYRANIFWISECVSIEIWYIKICPKGGKIIHRTHEHCEIGGVDEKFPDAKEVSRIFEDFGAPPLPAGQ